ncbi:MAG TPA: hypothetical protein DGT23_34085 [Micromonosporaceae bacterium]|nr:hypothetical protein [Micromonosporaceae bacterium]
MSLDDVDPAGAERAGLLGYLLSVPDPRARRGVRHALGYLLAIAACAVAAGACSLASRLVNGRPMRLRTYWPPSVPVSGEAGTSRRILPRSAAA